MDSTASDGAELNDDEARSATDELSATDDDDLSLGDAPAVARPLTESDLSEMLENTELAQAVAELLRGQKIAAFYLNIDAHTERHENRTKFTGPVTGNVNTGSGTLGVMNDVAGGGAASMYERLLTDELLKVERVYIEPSVHGAARALLEEKHVMVLHGPTRWGKRTMAIGLLALLHKDRILEIDPAAAPGQVQNLEFGHNMGFVWDTVPVDSVTSLDPYFFNVLSRRLGATHSHLVITVDAQFTLPSADANHYVIRCTDMPPVRDLLDSHLAWYRRTANRSPALEQAHNHEGVRSLIETRLYPRDVDRLASLLAAEPDGDDAIDKALSLFGAQVETEIDAWFSVHRQIGQCALMISLAVLNGASYDHVLAARNDLFKRIVPVDAQPSVEAAYPARMNDLQREMSFHLTQGYQLTEAGPTRVDLTEFDNPLYPPTILKYVWQEYRDWKPSILEWLYALGTHRDFEVRARAAAAAGELCQYSFRMLRDIVLRPWAKDANQQTRRNTALALGIPARREDTAAETMRLLRHWSSQTGNWRLAWTAAAAYGSLAGARFPDTAMRDLSLIASGGDMRLLPVISTSVASLYSLGRLVPDYYGSVLDGLAWWTKDGRNEIRTLIALAVFLALAQSGSHRDGDEGANSMIDMLGYDSPERQRIIGLWQLALRGWFRPVLRPWRSFANGSRWRRVRQMCIRP